MKDKVKNVLNKDKFSQDFKEFNDYILNLPKRNYFYLSIKNIVLMGMFLSLNIVLTLFSHYVFGLIPILGFFVIEISFVSILAFALINNFFYTLIFLEITIWLRLILGSEIIGLIAMNLFDGLFLIIFVFANYIFKKIIKNKPVKNWINNFFVYEIVISIFIILIVSGIAILVNYQFLMPIYFPMIEKNKTLKLLPIIFGLNVLKYTINYVFYLMTFKSLIKLMSIYKI